MFIDFHTHNPKYQYDIQNCYPFDTPPMGNFSIGVHPWFIPHNWQEAIEQVYQKSQLPNCKAFGECGLDKNSLTPLSEQVLIFEKHIAFSEDIKKPVIIHCVKSFAEIISVRKKKQPKQTWILHGFDKNNIVAHELIKHGIKLSFGKSVLYKPNLEAILLGIKNSDFLIETDDSDIPIEIIYQKIAEIKNISVEELQQIQQENYNLIFE